MSPETWREVRQFLTAALHLPSHGRHGYLAAHCQNAEVRAEVDALLACATVTTAPDEDPSRQGVSSDAFTPVPGTRVSHYRITRHVGTGGMGAVYAVGAASSPVSSSR